jgi:hypothetical protein
MLRFSMFVGMIFLTAGCGESPVIISEPSDFKGTVSFADGTKIKDVVVGFMPTTQGMLPAGAKVDQDGKFSVKMNPGKYSVYFGALDGKDAAKGKAEFQKIPENYKTASSDHDMTISAGEEIKVIVTK